MIEWIDDAFRVEQTKWKTWNSYDKEGNRLVTSLFEEDCVRATRFYLKGLQDGFDDDTMTYESTIGGKL